MYKLKQIPEDFVVIEENKFNLCDDGRFAVIKVTKKNYDTMKAVSTIANALKISDKMIGFAGNKDRIALTSQFISVPASKEISLSIKSIRLKDISLEYVGQITDRINLGDLEHNYFRITVRNLESKFVPEFEKKLDHIPNYYGEQRFSENNSEVGKFILKGDFKSAVTMMISSDSGEYERQMRDFLEKNKNEFVGAFKTLPKKLQKLYIHSYQSYLWNLAADEYIKKVAIENKSSKSKTKKNQKKSDVLIPLIGFDTDFKDDAIEDIYDAILRKEGISPRDFVSRKIPDLSAEGSQRSLYLKLTDFKYSKIEKDELNDNKKKMVVEFRLPKGSYATTAIKFLFN